MLVLTRKIKQKIHIGDNITITIVQVKGQSVRIGIDAPRETRVIRSELEAKAPAAQDTPQSEAEGAKALPAVGRPLLPASRPTRDHASQTGRPSPQGGPLSRMLTRRAPSADSTPSMRSPMRSGPALACPSPAC